MGRSHQERLPTFFKDIGDCDLILELRDARLPLSSRIGLFETKFQTKKRVVLFSKSDLLSKDRTLALKIWAQKHCPDFRLVGSGWSGPRLRSLIAELALQFRPKRSLLGITRILIAGLPNVGKSTLINRIKGKTVTRAANMPGITRGRMWIQLNPNCYLMDTPGVATLTQKESRRIVFALCRMISQGQFDWMELARFLHEELGRSLLFTSQDSQAFVEWDVDFGLFMDKISKRFGLLRTGGEPDYERCSARFFEYCEARLIGSLDLDHIG